LMLAVRLSALAASCAPQSFVVDMNGDEGERRVGGTATAVATPIPQVSDAGSRPWAVAGAVAPDTAAAAANGVVHAVVQDDHVELVD
jgi:hypothetical protein